jgi:hypothetical protein
MNSQVVVEVEAGQRDARRIAGDNFKITCGGTPLALKKFLLQLPFSKSPVHVMEALQAVAIKPLRVNPDLYRMFHTL